jgi:hypothetical protein
MKELTAAGLYRNYTCFPFNPVYEESHTRTKAGAKVVQFILKQKPAMKLLYRSFFAGIALNGRNQLYVNLKKRIKNFFVKLL